MADIMLEQENVGFMQQVPKPKAGKATKAAGKPTAAPLQSSSGHNAAGRGRTIEETYQKKSQLEHVLLRPDTYIGSVEKDTRTLWVYEDNRMVSRDVTYVPGLYKIFDEILVNAADNKQRDAKMDCVKVEINVEENFIQVWNNGKGVPVEVHAEEGIYVPELIFGQLLTSSNYDDSEQKTTGGRNGFGAKLANIFSTEFVIETADGDRQRRYKQVFTNNMGKKTEPLITKCKSSENWTCITFKPDLVKFHMDHLEKDTVALMSKRVLDIAGCLGKTVKVELNGSRLPVKSFSDYVGLYLASASGPSHEEPLPRVYEKVNDRWEVCISVSDGQFSQVSFVNSIATTRGGTHVQLVADQVANYLLEKIRKKAGKAAGALIKPAQVKNHLWVFVNALVVNPAFDSQTKEWLNTRTSDFGSSCKLSEEFMKKVTKCGIVDNVLSWATFKQNKDLKKTDGSKRQRLTGISKLDDANDAGGRNSQDCTLILTEGDSAKALAVSGLSVVGRDRYGVFPLRGKLLNVRDASHKQIQENTEIVNIKQIMGLQHDKEYNDLRSLRYGHIMIMTDQDHDGSHIKGLLINFIHRFWPSLLKIPNFLLEFVTPIVKATGPRGRTFSFYTIPEYEAWKESLGGNTKGWTIKYYKGLGTSTPKEAKEYFAALTQHRKEFYWSGEQDGDHIDLAFSKKKIEGRKQWLRGFEPGTFLDQSVSSINYTDFVNKELILFSLADNMRSIPSVMDGFKPGQRKILFSCFKRKLKSDVKVAQLAGYVSEHSAYHHGEASLMGTIVGLAQDFVGSNNINLLVPSGQFGTRLQGGKDAASPRYIYTRLHPLTRMIFPEADDCLLDYQNEDGQQIEPTWYMPILPMVLVNGSEGIGTGWSSSVPNYNPRDIVANLKHLMAGEPLQPMEPWYRGFKGTIEVSASKESGQTFTVTGAIEQTGSTVLTITELPVRKWTQDFKEFLEGMLTPSDKNKEPFIKDMKEYHTDTEVHFEIHLTEENIAMAFAEGLTKKFKLTTSMSTSNMHLFDQEGRITKYESPEQIIESFYNVRLEYYEKRKAAQVDGLQHELTKLDNRVRFILAVVRNEIIVNNRKKADLLAELKAKNFTPLPTGNSKRARKGPVVAGVPEDDQAEEDDDGVVEEVSSTETAGGTKLSFDYLLGMPLWSLTLEKVQELCRERDSKEDDLEGLLGTEPKKLWEKDLDEFMVALETFERESEEEKLRDAKQRSRAKGGARMAGGKGKAKKHMDDSEDDEFIPKKRPEPLKKVIPAPRPKPETAKPTAPITAPAIGQVMPVDKTYSKKGTTTTAGQPPKAQPVQPKPVRKQVVLDSDEEDEPLSLAERMTARSRAEAQAAPETSRIAPAYAPPRLDIEDEAEMLFTAERNDVEDVKADEPIMPPAPTMTAQAATKRAAAAAKPASTAAVAATKSKAGGRRKIVPTSFDLSDSEEDGDEFSFEEEDSDFETIEKVKGGGKKGATGKGRGKTVAPSGTAKGKAASAAIGQKRTKQAPETVSDSSSFGESTLDTEPRVNLGKPVPTKAGQAASSDEKAVRQPPQMDKSGATRRRATVVDSESDEEVKEVVAPIAGRRPARAAREKKAVQYLESDSDENGGESDAEFFSDEDSE